MILTIAIILLALVVFRAYHSRQPHLVDLQMRLTKLSVNKNKLRTNEVLGQGIGEPTVGKSFVFVSESLSEEIKAQGGNRYVTTSVVTEVSKSGKTITFKTLNSTYKLETLDKGISNET